MLVFYWLAEWQKISDLADQIKPAIEKTGTPLHRCRFFENLIRMHYRRDRYIVSDEIYDYAMAALNASLEIGEKIKISEARFGVGFCQLWKGELEEAEEEIQMALEIANKTGHVEYQARYLTYLTIIYRKQNQSRKCREYATNALHTALAGDMLEYVSTAKANLAWVAYHEGNLPEALAYGQEAMKIWEQSPLVYPFQWTALWPLIGVALSRSQISEAVENIRLMLQPTQQCLPERLTEVLCSTLEQWEGGESKSVTKEINKAIKMAKSMNLF